MSPHHDSTHDAKPQVTAEVTSPQQVLINGAPYPVHAGDNPYQQVYMQAQELARQSGIPTVVNGIDHMRREQSWFTVTDDGHIEPLPQPAAPAHHPTTPDPAGPAPAGHAHGVPDDHTFSQPSPQQPENGAGTDTADLSRLERRRLAEATGQRAFVSAPKEKPKGGMRKFLYNISGGSINMGPTDKEKKARDLAARIARPLETSHNTAVLSLKGGIGKTSTTVGVGMTLAEHRGDLPCAIDANPDSGDLVERALGERAFQAQKPSSITDLLRNIEGVDSLTTLQTYLQQAGRLHVLPGEQDPEVSDSLTAEEWLRIHEEFAKYYQVILTDCGTGVTHNAMRGILQTSDNLIITAGFAVSGAQRALQTLTWLADHDYEQLAQESIVVITDKERVSERVDKAAIRESLRGMCRRLVVVPFDRAVVDGDRINLDMLQAETRQAYMEIAASIVDNYR